MVKWPHNKPTGALILSEGTIFKGFGLGKEGKSSGEVCFNTAISGYQEIMTDPSYCSQIITFTFPHIGNVGLNKDDDEGSNKPFINGAIFRSVITNPSNWRSEITLNKWLEKNGIVGLYGIDTRELTNLIRKKGLINGTIVNDSKGIDNFDIYLEDNLSFEGINNQDLAIKVTCEEEKDWNEKEINIFNNKVEKKQSDFHVVVIDYGVKKNILRCLASRFNKITIVPCTYSFQDIMKLKPDGIFLSNGPGDPSATGKYAIPTIKKIIEKNIPIFGICIGHQLLALALGIDTYKMHQGHHGANHPVKDLEKSQVNITSMNHGFAVKNKKLPKNIKETHISLFDGSNCGIEMTDKLVFSVQHHPEASPGPNDSYYLFDKFLNNIEKSKNA
ncbi:MAG: glutamine-hydrolyzing carbamoyl-phosphate synthase small subunit [Pseudomonadota bacterium]|nr:glutamine-hydrolyzing carbamoyl-phosphate synthase small subunit [Pseudomonadota bacterium]